MEKDEPLTTRSKVEVFCQTTGARRLTRIEFKKTGIHMLKVSENLRNMPFLRRMNSITNAEDVVADEVVYHDVCCVKAKREAQPKLIKKLKICSKHCHISSSSIALNQNFFSKRLRYGHKTMLIKFIKKY